MSRLIDANALIDEANSDGAYGYVDAKQIADAPTIDAVPVVRCKDCKYGEVDDADLPTQYLCNYHGADWNDENHFCSYGKRKDGDDND